LPSLTALIAGRIPNARIALVISNREDAPGIETARSEAERARHSVERRDREAHDREVVARSKNTRVDLICLAGYMRLLFTMVCTAVPQQILIY